MENKYHYFVSYNYGQGFGNLEIFRDKKIEGMDDVKTIVREIEKHMGFRENSVVIINFQLF